jgi:hypothetical protein
MKTTKTQYNLPRGDVKKLEALKNFFYEKYGDKYSGNDTNEKNYRLSILSYLYTGDFKYENNKLSLYSILREQIDSLNQKKISELYKKETDNKEGLVDEDIKKLNELKKSQLSQKNKVAEWKKLLAKKDPCDVDTQKLLKLNKAFEANLDVIYNNIKSGWENVVCVNSSYIERLKQSNTKVQYLIVYEAPPYQGDYILGKFNDGNITDAGDISTYWGPIVECFGQKVNSESNIDFLVRNKIGLIDISLVPLPLKNIRKEWSTMKNFKIGKKQLPVHLFEWALEHFFDKIKGNIKHKPKIAIGMPPNTSVSIFDYFSSNPFPNISKAKNVVVDISVCNTNKTKEKSKLNLKGVTLKLHKCNVVGGNGYPNGTLMKLALGKK